jgi:GNAT superfamily N-acetyltransferase
MAGPEVRIAPAADGELGLLCEISTRAVPRRPRSEAFIGYLRRRDPEASFVLGWVGGEAVAAGSVFRMDWIGDASMVVGQVQVLPQWRRQGIGGTVWEWMRRRSRERGMTRFGSNVDQDQPDGRRFAERHGFTVDDVVRSVSLDLRTVADEDVALPEGIEVATYAERPDLARGMWHVDMVAGHDIPQAMPTVDLEFEQWCDAFVDRPGFLPEGVLAALDGDEVVGFAAISQDTGKPTRAWHNMTAVLPSHRGRGIALAMKRWQIQWARRAGLEELQTGNHEGNAPMRAINRKLGYRPLPDEYHMSVEL